MPPRQPNMPFGPGMGRQFPQRMGPPMQQQFGSPAPFSMFQAPNRQGPMNRGIGFNQNRGGAFNQMRGGGFNPRGGGGGLLSRIFGRGGQAAAPVSQVSPFSIPGQAVQQTAGGGGILKSLTNPGSLTGILNNTQRVLSAAQNVGPMVSQYGPLVKNIPAMWKLYRGLKNSDSGSDKAESTSSQSKSKSESANLKSESQNAKTESSKKKIKINEKKSFNTGGIDEKESSGKSVPRLFI